MWSPRQEFGPREATETPVCRLDVAVLYVEYSLAQTFHQVTVNGNYLAKSCTLGFQWASSARWAPLRSRDGADDGRCESAR